MVRVFHFSLCMELGSCPGTHTKRETERGGGMRRERVSERMRAVAARERERETVQKEEKQCSDPQLESSSLKTL